MKTGCIRKAVSAIALLLLSATAYATPIYVGSYDVVDGPSFTLNPPVYSALEAAALVFGPPASGFYEISTAGTDPTLITNTGWYAQVGIGPGIFAESYKLDLGTPGYAGSGWNLGDDISAYVGDHFFDAGQGTNYVFVSVPEPATIALFGIGLAGLGFSRRRKRA